MPGNLSTATASPRRRQRADPASPSGAKERCPSKELSRKAAFPRRVFHLPQIYGLWGIFLGCISLRVNVRTFSRTRYLLLITFYLRAIKFSVLTN